MDWDIPVDYWVIEMHSGGERDQKVKDLLTKHNYREARVNMMSYCLKLRPRLFQKRIVDTVLEASWNTDKPIA